jgi:hypothetical protein
MAIVEVKVPQLSESVAEATLLQWKKKVGEAVSADEILRRTKWYLKYPRHRPVFWLKYWWLTAQQSPQSN